MTDNIEIGSEWVSRSNTGRAPRKVLWCDDRHVVTRTADSDPPYVWTMRDFLFRLAPKPNDDIIYVWLNLEGMDLNGQECTEMDSRPVIYSTERSTRVRLVEGTPENFVVAYNRTTGAISIEAA